MSLHPVLRSFVTPISDVESAAKAKLAAAVLMVSALPSSAEIVINEIHYSHDDRTVPAEYVELKNADAAMPVDLSGWRLTGGVEFTFPEGTEIDAGGYLVVAENTTVLQETYGVAAVGSYGGNLSGSGEEVELVDASGARKDRVDYRVGFPWPTVSKGGGTSMELINTKLDNDLGSSWRPGHIPPISEFEYLPMAADGWRYRPGVDEASDPVSAWREPGFVEDASWVEHAFPIGYGGISGLTLAPPVIEGMQGQYFSLFLRGEFEVPPDEPAERLEVRFLVDDGAIIWVNGSEVVRHNVDAGEPVAGGEGTGTPANAPGAETVWESVTINSPGFLVEGTNTIAVQLFNESIGSSDLGFDLEIKRPANDSTELAPTPGGPNLSTVANPPPNIRQVDHLPQSPTSADDVVITAKVTDPDGVASVALAYQVVAPGDYIRRSDDAYEAPENWTTMAMHDDGAGGDAAAADAIYSVLIPAAVQEHRHLVRYRVTVEDTAGASVQTPFFDDGQPNFAYFVYDGVPAWTGADEPGETPEMTFPAEMMDDIATYHLIADGRDVTNSQYNSGFDGRRMLGTMVYDGVVYDHIEFNNRGEFSTYQSGKNKWRFHFNTGRDFEARDNYGRKYAETWGSINLNANASPWAPVNRGMAGLDEALSFRVYQLAGVNGPNTSYVHFRVVDDADEAPASNQYGGDLWGLYITVEQPDGSFLDERGLSDGNVYKIEGGGNGTGDKKHQGATQSTNSSDWSRFSRDSSRAQPEQWWRDNVDLPSYYNFRAVNRLVGNVDIREGWNHYFYHSSLPDGSDGPWFVIPWDLDMALVAETHWSGTIAQKNALRVDALDTEFRNRCREITDLMTSDRAPDGGQIGQLIDEFADIVNPPGQGLTWADLDQFMWNYNPRTKGNPNQHSGQGNHKGNFYFSPFTDSRQGGSWRRTLESQDHEGFAQFVLNYTTDMGTGETYLPGNGRQDGYGFNFLDREASFLNPTARTSANGRNLESDLGNLPNKPTIRYTGTPGFPSDGLAFESSAFSDPQGDGTFAAMEWRIGEIAAPGLAGNLEGGRRVYEIEENWSTDEVIAFDPNIAPPASAVRRGHTYRARVRHKDDTGRWSRWSDPVQFVASAPDVTAYQEDLIISEIMYHSPAGPGVEFIEIYNRGGAPLGLTDVRFTKGIDFDFADGTVLEPGAYLLVVRDLAVFEAEYGAGHPVAGEYGGNDEGALSNGGERIKLALGRTAVHEFTYDDDAPWPTVADGQGPSLVLVTTSAPEDTPGDPLGHGDPANWRASITPGGTPGAPEDAYSTFPGDDPGADDDGDGLNAFVEYALGSSDDDGGSGGDRTAAARLPDGTLVFTYTRNATAGDVLITVEVAVDTASDPVDWETDPDVARFVGETANGDGTAMVTYEIVPPQDPAGGALFVRLRIEQVAVAP